MKTTVNYFGYDCNEIDSSKLLWYLAEKACKGNELKSGFFKQPHYASSAMDWPLSSLLHVIGCSLCYVRIVKERRYLGGFRDSLTYMLACVVFGKPITGELFCMEIYPYNAGTEHERQILIDCSCEDLIIRYQRKRDGVLTSTWVEADINMQHGIERSILHGEQIDWVWDAKMSWRDYDGEQDNILDELYALNETNDEWDCYSDDSSFEVDMNWEDAYDGFPDGYWIHRV